MDILKLLLLIRVEFSSGLPAMETREQVNCRLPRPQSSNTVPLHVTVPHGAANIRARIGLTT
jgi:hypothetical protein